MLRRAAVLNDDIDMLTTLQGYGADLSASNTNGRTPLHQVGTARAFYPCGSTAFVLFGDSPCIKHRLSPSMMALITPRPPRAT